MIFMKLTNAIVDNSKKDVDEVLVSKEKVEKQSNLWIN
jgi:hypothetical protein